uniref:PDZ and LIM domain protein 3 n=1 Tax=Eptatretus burgeri TaxID=7764 RepID=A0A8C4QEU4_EPTBU
MRQQIKLQGSAPWGFRLTGGRDLEQPLVITRVTPNSIASEGNLQPGDAILAISDHNAEEMTHAEAQDAIKACGGQLVLLIDRPESVLWSPNVMEEGKFQPYKMSLASEPQEPDYFEHKYNVRPKPYIPASGMPPTIVHQLPTPSPPTFAPSPSIISSPSIASSPSIGRTTPLLLPSGCSTPSTTSTVLYAEPTDLKEMARAAPNRPIEVAVPGARVIHAQFNSPLQMYSDENVLESLHGQVSSALHLDPDSEMSSQAEHIPSHHDLSQDSEAYKLRQENLELGSAPRQSGSFQVLQAMLDQENGGSDRPMGIRSVKAPIPKVGAVGGETQKLPICSKCGTGIMGQVVKARDHMRHPECFVCGDCGVNLKQKGFFFVEGQLFCEMHARARSQPPPGYELITTPAK